MTDAQRRGPQCLDSGTLAAFIDGRLPAEERVTAEAHLADCDDCYEAMVESSGLVGELQDRAPAVPLATPARSRRWWMTGSFAAAAAVVLAVWIGPGMIRELRLTAAMDDLVSAVGTTRFTEARLSDDFAWGPRPSVTRSGSGSAGEVSPAVIGVTARIHGLTADRDDADMLRARGVAALASGDVARAIQWLQRGVARDPRNARAQTDLAAALLERYRQNGLTADAQAALAAADAALREDEHALPPLFNRALAMEALKGRGAALPSWEAYLRNDSTSAWADEARAHVPGR